ncbi:MAG TPA: helix-turn-helix transcriptional regulator [bacterium]|nr:helix-turn-helix transcriptional regulator [bacterium]
MTPKKLDEGIGDESKTYKKLAGQIGCNNADIAKFCGVSESKVAEWESGKAVPDKSVIETLEALAHITEQKDGRAMIESMSNLPIDYELFFAEEIKSGKQAASLGDFILKLAKGIVPLGIALGLISKYVSKNK